MLGDRAKHCIFELYKLIGTEREPDQDVINEVMEDATKELDQLIEKANRNESLKYKCDVMTETVLQLEKENKELQRLAEIGKAFKYAMTVEHYYDFGVRVNDGELSIKILDGNIYRYVSLVDWYRKEISNE